MYRDQKKREEGGTRKGTREQALAPEEFSHGQLFRRGTERRPLGCKRTRSRMHRITLAHEQALVSFLIEKFWTRAEDDHFIANW